MIRLPYKSADVVLEIQSITLAICMMRYLMLMH